MAAAGEQLWVTSCGLVPYDAARRAQVQLAAARQADQVPDLLLLLEHPPVYTRGRRSRPGELPMGEEWYRAQGIEVCDSDRGGAVTYHGPGQLVCYPIVSLKPYRDDVHAYVRRIEQVLIGALGAWGVEAQTIEGLTGVWTAGSRPASGAAAVAEARKIGSIGIHISRGVTTHGFAVNVNNDLQPFEWIVPCGIEGCRMTSLSRELGREQDLRGFADSVAETFAAAYGRPPTATSPAELARRVPGLAGMSGSEGQAAGLEAALP